LKEKENRRLALRSRLIRHKAAAGARAGNARATSTPHS
jgi:hypothetical protein